MEQTLRKMIFDIPKKVGIMDKIKKLEVQESMKEGMLWYDDQKDVSIKNKIISAIKFFESKYGYVPEKCFVNPVTLGKPFKLNNKTEILADNYVIANHFWLEFTSTEKE